MKNNIIKNRHRKQIEETSHGQLSIVEWEECKRHFDYSCAYCGSKTAMLCRDHFLPLSQGGSSSIDNIIPCCQKCNNSKSSRNPHLWYKNTNFYSYKREQRIIDYIKSFQ